jgi:hypothetical protein
MPAATYDFTIEQGATLIKPIVWKDSDGDPVDLTGYSARMQMRRNYSTPVLLQLTTGAGNLVITPSTGTVTMVFDAALTESITWLRAKYDLELESSVGVVTRILEGDVTISREITK